MKIQRTLTIKILHRLKNLPTWLVSTSCERLYQRRWTSPGLTIPSTVTLEAISNFFQQVGIQDGATILVHSSWRHLASGNFSPAQLIKQIMAIVGEEGTVAMPAFPPYFMQQPSTVFDVKKTPTGGGLLADSFRRYPGVRRSINLNHSVCALGPNADFLLRDHQRSETSWDQYSPYYRLREIEDAWIVGLGVGHRLKVATSLHCVESALRRDNLYYRKLFRLEICYEFRGLNGVTGHHCFKRPKGQIYTPKLAKYFSADELIEDTIQGLEVYAIRARTLIDKAIALGREGKTMYVWPVPWPWYFKKTN